MISLVKKDMPQFVNEQIQKLEKNRGVIKLKLVQDEKDLSSLDKQVLMLEGSIEKLKQLYGEWLRYDKDTQLIRVQEAQQEELKRQAAEKEKSKSPKKRPGKRKSNNAADKKKKTV